MFQALCIQARLGAAVSKGKHDRKPQSDIGLATLKVGDRLKLALQQNFKLQGALAGNSAAKPYP